MQKDQLEQLITANRFLQQKVYLQQKQISALQNQIKILKKNQQRAQNQVIKIKEANKQKQDTQNSIPAYFNSQKLKIENDSLKADLNQLNNQKNRFQSLTRQQQAEIKKMKKRMRQIQIIQQNRQQRYKQAINNLQPIVVQLQPDIDVVSQNFRIICQLRAGIVRCVLNYFTKSASTAFQKKISSLSLFTTNLQSVKKNQLIKNNLLVYVSLRNLVKKHFENYGKSVVGDQKYMSLLAGQDVSNKTYMRNEINLWLESNLLDIIEKGKKRKSNYSGSKYSQSIYQMIALYYRIKYPVSEGIYKIDIDLNIRLQDKIVLYLMQYIEQ